ncbi:MAG: phosphatidate cytidylyltransferase, partial [Blautia sp.]|nr:phosphatidate cytidylyltransferase [Blautia sp.]
MFKTRLLSGILLLAVAYLTIMCGGYVLFFTLLGISLIGMQELFKAMGIHKEGMNSLEIAGYASAIVYYAGIYFGFEKFGMLTLIISLVLLMFVYVFSYP